MSKLITGTLRVQPVREGKFELRDQTEMRVATCDHEDHAKALANNYNAGLIWIDQNAGRFLKLPEIT